MLRRYLDLFTRSSADPGQKAPPEVPWLRGIGIVTLIAFVATAFATHPHPGLGSARAAAILAGTLAFAVVTVSAVPMRAVPERQRIARMVAVSALSCGLLALQPNALWILTPYVIASVSAAR